nr:IMV membrane protein [Wadden Sea poxvirus]
MTLSAKEIFSTVGLTILAIIMIVSGCALSFKSLAPYKIVTMRSMTFNKIINILEYIAIFIFVPGTISLYSAYIKSIINK